jgi:hypothetical protein
MVNYYLDNLKHMVIFPPYNPKTLKRWAENPVRILD